VIVNDEVVAVRLLGLEFPQYSRQCQRLLFEESEPFGTAASLSCYV